MAKAENQRREKRETNKGKLWSAHLHVSLKKKLNALTPAGRKKEFSTGESKKEGGSPQLKRGVAHS